MSKYRAHCNRKQVVAAAGAVALFGGFGIVPAAQAATFGTPATEYTAGGVLHNFVYYAKSGSTLTLNVKTDSAARCVAVAEVTPIQTSTTSKTFWDFSAAAAAASTADGVQSKTVTIGEDHNTKNGTVSGCKTRTATSAAAYTLDNTAPTLSGAPTVPPNGGDGWYTGDVTIAWSASDNGSGVTGNPANSIISGEGTGLTTSTEVLDRVGNRRTATGSPAVKIDRTAPVTQPTAPVSTDWNNVAQTVALRASDNGSGVSSTHYTLDGGALQTGDSVEISAEGVHTLEYWSVDTAGNVEETRTATIKIDKTNPTINHTKTPAANADGWNNTNVTVKFECADNAGGSGIKSCTGVVGDVNNGVTITTEGRTTPVLGTAVDNAGNSVEDPATVSLDKTKPTIDAELTRVPDSNGWYNADVTVDFTYDDNLSGVKSNGVASKTFAEGANQGIEVDATDTAGNTHSDGVSGINVDKTAPTTTSDAPSAWQRGPVTVTFVADDQAGLSGVDLTEYSVDGGAWTRGTSVIVTLDGVYDLKFRSVDIAGNVEDASSATVSIDRALPTIDDGGPTSPADGNSGWYKTAVINGFAASDLGSGLADAVQASFTKGSGIAEGTAVTIASGSVADIAGNLHPGIDSAAFKIDLTAPEAPTFTGIEAREYVSGTVPAQSAISCTATDATSGLASCSFTGYGTTAGQHILTATAHDNAGHTSTNTLTYSVAIPAMTIKGFHNPIGEANSFVKKPGETAPTATATTVWQAAKGGSTIPLKFEIFNGTVESTTVGDVKSFQSTKLSTCTAGGSLDAIEELASAGASSLRYDAADGGQFIQNWKTPTVSGDTCYRVALTTTDGSAVYTFVRLRK